MNNKLATEILKTITRHPKHYFSRDDLLKYLKKNSEHSYNEKTYSDILIYLEVNHNITRWAPLDTITIEKENVVFEPQKNPMITKIISIRGFIGSCILLLITPILTEYGTKVWQALKKILT